MIRRPAKKAVNRRTAQGNRRKNQHLLEVKVRSRKAAELRNRRLIAWAARAVILCALLGSAAWGGRELLRKFVWENGEFAIEAVDVQTDGSLSRQQIVEMAGVREGANIFSFNLSEAHRRLAECPQVLEADIRRELPGRLVLRVRERKPVAWLAGDLGKEAPNTDNAFLVDAEGQLMRPALPGASAHALPIISGVPLDGLRPGMVSASGPVRAALDLIRLNEANSLFDIASIDASRDYRLEATSRRRMRATFSPDRIDLQLARLNRILTHMESVRRDLATINLMVDRNIPVTYMPLEDPAAREEPEPAAAPGAPEPPPAPQTPDAATPPAREPAKKPAPQAKPKATPKPTPKATPKPTPKTTPRPAAEEAPVMRAEPVRRAGPAAPRDARPPEKRGLERFNPFKKRDG